MKHEHFECKIIFTKYIPLLTEHIPDALLSFQIIIILVSFSTLVSVGLVWDLLRNCYGTFFRDLHSNKYTLRGCSLPSRGRCRSANSWNEGGGISRPNICRIEPSQLFCTEWLVGLDFIHNKQRLFGFIHLSFVHPLSHRTRSNEPVNGMFASSGPSGRYGKCFVSVN